MFSWAVKHLPQVELMTPQGSASAWITRHLDLLPSVSATRNKLTDSQSWNAPVCSWLLPSLDEERQTDQIDGRSDSQGSNELQHESHQPWESEHDLKKRRHQDRSLDLGKEQTLNTGNYLQTSGGSQFRPVLTVLQPRTNIYDLDQEKSSRGSPYYSLEARTVLYLGSELHRSLREMLFKFLGTLLCEIISFYISMFH